MNDPAPLRFPPPFEGVTFDKHDLCRLLDIAEGDRTASPEDLRLMARAVVAMMFGLTGGPPAGSDARTLGDVHSYYRRICGEDD